MVAGVEIEPLLSIKISSCSAAGELFKVWIAREGRQYPASFIRSTVDTVYALISRKAMDLIGVTASLAAARAGDTSAGESPQ